MSIEKKIGGRIILLRNPAESVFIFLLIIQSFLQQFAVFVCTVCFLIDLAYQIDIIAEYFYLFAFKYFTVHFDKFKQS